MKKVIRLTESDLTKIVRRVLDEQSFGDFAQMGQQVMKTGMDALKQVPGDPNTNPMNKVATNVGNTVIQKIVNACKKTAVQALDEITKRKVQELLAKYKSYNTLPAPFIDEVMRLQKPGMCAFFNGLYQQNPQNPYAKLSQHMQSLSKLLIPMS